MKILIILFIGIIAGTIDIIPMIKKKIDKYSIVSAFVFHLIAPFILSALKSPLSPWLEGGVLYILLALPTIILIARDDKKSVPIVVGSSITTGMIIGLIGNALGII